MKKNECTFTKMCGCYVNGEKEIVLKLNETFLNLEDEEFYKYLDISKKTLSGAIGNNLMELEFPMEEEDAGGKQQFLMGLKESKLKNEALLDAFYQLVIDTYDYAGNYLILLYHDAYDVMTKTSDRRSLDESEEVYEYLICAICPVALSKPALGYLETENRIGPRQRDWVVGAPDTGFIFPAFTERSTDIHSIVFYVKDPKEPHNKFIESGFGCTSKLTATQQKNTFQTIINKAITDERERDNAMMEIQESLTQLIDDHALYQTDDEDLAILTQDSIREILTNSGLPEEVTQKIEQAYEETFSEAPPIVDHLLDNKVLAVSAQRKVEKALAEQVHELQEKLQITLQDKSDSNYYDDSNNSYGEDDAIQAKINAAIEEDPSLAPITEKQSVELENTKDSSDTSTDENPTGSDDISEDHATTNATHNHELNSDIDATTGALYDVILRVTPEKATQIHSQIIDGKKCIVIPLDENEQANVNGIKTVL